MTHADSEVSFRRETSRGTGANDRVTRRAREGAGDASVVKLESGGLCSRREGLRERSTMRALWTAREVAQLLGRSEKWVYRAVGERRVPSIRITKGTVRFDPREIEAWLAALKVPAED